MADRAAWSLAGRLRSRLLAVSVLTTFVVSIVVAILYGYDVPELRQRTVFDLTRQIADDLPASASPDKMRDLVNEKNPIFTRYPGAYEWALIGPKGRVVASSSDEEIERTRFPPGLPPEEWSAPCRHGGWEAGKTFVIDGALWHVVVVAHSDPAGLLTRLILGAALIHVILPLAPFAILIAFVTSGVVRRTLKPLESLAAQARRVRELNDIRPLDPTGAPVEVAELIDSLNSALGGLRESVERERSFLLDASHAMRTPLAALKARLELDGANVDASRLKADVDGLIRLTSQLLASANAERLVVDPRALADLGEVARSVVMDMTPVALQAGIDLGVRSDDEPPCIRGDSEAIAHALKNLVENALKVTPRSGSVTIEVGSTPPTLKVVDQGPGVSASRKLQIFRRHSRARFGDGAGAGLGLSIVRRIVSAHGGSVSVEDAPGGGAAFAIRFSEASGGQLGERVG